MAAGTRRQAVGGGWPGWALFWLAFGGFGTGLNGFYLMLRPRSFAPGFGSGLFWGHQLYSEVDHSYKTEEGMQVGFTWINGLLQVLCFGMHVAALGLYFANHRWARLAAFTVSALTVWQVTMEVGADAMVGWKETGHAPWPRWLFVFFLPNLYWIIAPFCTCVWLAGRMQAAMDRGDGKEISRNRKED